MLFLYFCYVLLHLFQKEEKNCFMKKCLRNGHIKYEQVFNGNLGGFHLVVSARENIFFLINNFHIFKAEIIS